jgi:phosphatidate cytidylyltransferase
VGLSCVGGPYFVALVALFGLLAGYEFYELVLKSGQWPFKVAGLLLIALFMLDAYMPALGVLKPALAAAVMIPMVWQILQTGMQGFLMAWALAITGALYVGGLFSYLISVRNLPQGLAWLLLTFAATWTCDSAAYLVGVNLGKHGFFTHISPRKTWEGAIGGLVGGAVATMIAGRFVGLPWWLGLLLGWVLAVGITFGDLAESLVKRQVGVKDSSHLIPGHGGMLDRIDSLMFAGVIVYYFVQWFWH